MTRDMDDSTPLLYRNDGRGRNYKTDRDTNTVTQDSETVEQYKSRWWSIRLVYVVVFFNAISLTITLPSIWTYLKVVTHPAASASLLGWAVSAFSLGQIVASPFFGAWANCRRSTKEPMLISMLLTCLSYTLYMYLDSLPNHKDYYMIAVRVVIGVGAGNTGVLRSYISGATTLEERTSTMANFNIFGSVGFVVGPMLQAAFVLLSYPGPVDKTAFHFNMYTAPGLFAAISSFVNIILLIFIFKEHRISDETGDVERNIQALKDPKELTKQVDYIAVFSCILLYFVVAFSFVTIQTIANPLTMHMYGWGKAKATFVQGIVTGVASLQAIGVYVAMKVISKWISERSLLLGGFVVCFSAFFVFLPWGDQMPPRAMAYIVDNAENNFTFTSGTPFEPTNRPHYVTMDTDKLLRHDQEIDLGSSLLTLSNASGELKPFPAPVHNSFNLASPRDKFTSSQIPVNGATLSKTLASLSKKSLLQAEKLKENHVRTTIMDSASGKDIIDRTSSLKGTSSEKHKIDRLSSLKDPISEMDKTDRSSLTYNQIRLADKSDMSQTTTESVTVPTAGNVTVELTGCPWDFDWCSYVPVVNLIQYICGTVLIGIGYPMCHVIVFTIYSKILGPMPQGLWMGCFAASGSLAGMLGPIFITHVYDSYGPRVAFSGCCAVLATIILFMLFVYQRLIPFSHRISFYK